MTTAAEQSAVGKTTGRGTRDALARRARALARPAIVERADLVSLVLFGIGGVQHGVEASFVREVLRRPRLWMVPSAPEALIGVANVRGEIVAVADISSLLGLAAPGVPGPVIVLHGAGPSLGLLVDAVHDLVDVPADSLVPLPPNDGSSGAPPHGLLLGVTPLAVVLSGSALLNDTRMTTTDPRSGR